MNYKIWFKECTCDDCSSLQYVLDFSYNKNAINKIFSDGLGFEVSDWVDYLDGLECKEVEEILLDLDFGNKVLSDNFNRVLNFIQEKISNGKKYNKIYIYEV